MPKFRDVQFKRISTRNATHFRRNLDDPGAYEKKDAYGNRDLAPAAKAIRMLDNCTRQLDSLPEELRDFYGRVLISRIEKRCLSKPL